MQPQVRRGAHSMEKWTGWDLNPRPLPCQDSDLPADLPARWAARKLAGIKRYPPKEKLQGARSSPGERSSRDELHTTNFRGYGRGAQNSRAVLSPVIIDGRGRRGWVDE